ncbi:hypothetical protein K7640_14780 [Micromonospora sp. PLK6-60]|uniref:hypothetical protein n=1 Tax=Micromonospora sp. PLK6-60 TaxID=2873383 RepID=UPI001CA74DC8|nr:hypothetical protein [Micromonospora sp. PLK6-60]MBY8873098.1 hypothetical protein [Micromonospora sp. PLK6-60]
MKSGARIGLAVAAGYVLGRRKKLRTALTLAAAVAAGRASQRPGGLLKVGTDLLNAPQLGNLTRLGTPLATAGKAAATAAAGSGIDALSGRLRGSADALRRRSAGGGEAEGGPDSAPDEEQELDEQPAAQDDEAPDDGAERDEQPAPVRRRRGR